MLHQPTDGKIQSTVLGGNQIGTKENQAFFNPQQTECTGGRVSKLTQLAED